MHVELSTVDQSGSRKWLYPIVAKGKWFFRRRVVAYALILWLLIVPWTYWGGRQTLLFDLIDRKFYIFGYTYYPNESVIFLGFIFLVISSILLLTALFGRVFCGWACPQTVFLEFVYRPIEQLIEGMGIKQKRFNQKGFTKIWPYKLLKWGVFAVISLIIGNTLVAYFSGSHHLREMIADGPLEHWTPFLAMLGLSGFVYFQFSWFREQVCTFVCPYGRLQSLLLDRESLIVAYDEKRGEPRGKPSKVTGDCVDCLKCVKVCPTGIDIREGLQLECVSCTQCIDACDDVMTKLGRKPGLIAYRTQNEMAGKPRRVLRPRLGIYGAMMLLGAGLIFVFGVQRNELGATVHREFGDQLFTETSAGTIINPLRVHLQNRTDVESRVELEALSPQGMQIDVPQGEIKIPAQSKRTVHFLVKLPKEDFFKAEGKLPIEIRAKNQNGEEQVIQTHVFGPVGTAE